MTPTQEAWEGARRFAAQFSGMIKAMERLQDISSVEQAVEEKRTLLDQATVQHRKFMDSAAAEKTAALADVEKAKQEATSLRVANEGETAKAKAEIDKLFQTANEQAANIVSTASAKAEKIVSDAAASVQATEHQRGILAQQIADLNSQIGELSATRDKRRGELDAVNRQIASLADKAK